MAFSDELQQFKKFNRQRRIQYSEESFAKGIKYATSPLDLGYARNLVNFDLGTDGKSLLPRQGLRTFEVSQEVNLTENFDETKDYPEKYIYHASECIEEDGNTYRQILLGNIHVTDANKNKTVKTGNLDLITIYPRGLGGPTEGYSECEIVDVLAQHTEKYDFNDYEFFFNSPSEASIHGIDLEDPSLIGSHIGTELAAEGTKKYYCFRKNKKTGKTAPVFITFNKSKNCYEFEELAPQRVSAYNAALSMYNMLQDDPYVFPDQYGSDSLHFMGVYTLDENGKQRQATYRNTPYTFRMNYATAKNQKYKVVWEWKEPSSSNWTELKTQYYTFSENTPPELKIDWSVPVNSAIIRIQAFPEAKDRTIVDVKTFSTTAPSGATNGQYYFNPDTKKVYKYNGSTWTDEAVPRTSVIYKRLDDQNTLYRWAGNEMLVTDEYDYVASQAMLVNLVLGEAMSESSQNLDYVNYDLSTCKGMVTWGQRVCVYAPDKALNMLFVSEPNNPAWFPFPRNVSLFSENIIKCIAYLDYLLVFTTDAIYQLTLGADGDSWTEVCLQKNLNIQMCDVPLIRVIKNMVFFKSSNYYYMVVPNSTSTTGLTIANISTNITLLLDDFKEAVKETLVETYDNKTEYYLLTYKNHVNYKNIYNVYTFKSDKGFYINFYLIYNIETRYWYTYCIESKTMIDSYKIDVADVNIYMSYVPTIVRNKISYSIQFAKFDENRHDFYIHPYLNIGDKLEDICRSKQFFKNYQYIDTGYREHESDFKKRFRELQFKLNNYAQLDLTFYTQFMIDGYVRQDEADHEIHQVIDKADPRFGVITYDRVYNEESGHFVPGATILGETPLIDEYYLQIIPGHYEPGVAVNPGGSTDSTIDAIYGTGQHYVPQQIVTKRRLAHNPEETTRDKLMWKLDISEFPETVFWKVRFPVSGKGYVPRLKILNMDQEKYEMLNISWIFRQLYSR